MRLNRITVTLVVAATVSALVPAGAGLARPRARVLSSSTSAGGAADEAHAADAAAVAAANLAASTVVEVRVRDGRPDIRTWQAGSPAEAEAAADEIADAPGVVAAEVDRVVRIARQGGAAAATDPVRAEQWGLARLRAPGVWASHDASGQLIAVVDTGVDGTHPDLAPVVVPGTDLVQKGGDGRRDPEGHGTHVAGIAAAVADDGAGVSGLAHRARILPVRVLNDKGFGSDAHTAQGIVWAVDNGATVVNLSLASSWPSAAVRLAVAYAERSGVVVVAAAGNTGAGSAATYPAAHHEVVGVGAITPTDGWARFSSRGDWVDLAAPGVAILSTRAGGGHELMDGTSMATPFVAAAAALVRAEHPSATPSEVRGRLLASAEDRGAPGWDSQFGHGVVDPLTALAADWRPVAGAPYTDLGSDVELDRAVTWLTGRGVTGGCKPGRFCPEREVTRAQMAALLWRYAGQPRPSGRPRFRDVPNGVYYADAVAWLTEARITTGCTADRFCPERTVTRAQMAAFLWRLSGSPWAELSVFGDVPNRAFYAGAVSWLAQRGVTAGCRPGRYCPEDRVGRGQLAMSLWRLYHQR